MRRLRRTEEDWGGLRIEENVLATFVITTANGGTFKSSRVRTKENVRRLRTEDWGLRTED